MLLEYNGIVLEIRHTGFSKKEDFEGSSPFNPTIVQMPEWFTSEKY